MKKTKFVGALLVTVLAFALFSCSSPSGGDNSGSGSGSGSESGSGSGSGGGSSSNHTEEDQPISGPLTTVETWTGKNEAGESITYYINSSYTIKDGGSLTIEDGAIVKLGPNGCIVVNNTGAINATGTIFTSYRDPSGKKIIAAGDTEPAPGDWKYIKIYGGTGKFEGCSFKYGGNGNSTLYACKYTTKGKLRVNNCTFAYNTGSKKVANDIDAALKYDDALDYNEQDNCVTNTVFKNNVWALSIPAHFTLDASNTFGTSAEEKNEYNYVHINSCSIKTEAVWHKQNVPYLYVGVNRINLNGSSSGNGKLTIKGGEDAEHPNTICFATVGLGIDKGGELNVEDNVLFRNSPETEGTKFKGLYCDTSRKYYISSSSSITITQIILLPSTKIRIENYEPSETKYTSAHEYFDGYSAEIKNVNNYDTFKY